MAASVGYVIAAPRWPGRRALPPATQLLPVDAVIGGATQNQLGWEPDGAAAVSFVWGNNEAMSQAFREIAFIKLRLLSQAHHGHESIIINCEMRTKQPASCEYPILLHELTYGSQTKSKVWLSEQLLYSTYFTQNRGANKDAINISYHSKLSKPVYYHT